MRPAEKHQLALRLAARGNAEEALSLLGDALGEEESSELWNDWAALQFTAGQTDEAEAAFRAALDLEPGNLQALLNLGALLASTARHSEARDILAQAPSDPAQSTDYIALQSLSSQVRQALSNDPGCDESFLREYLRRFASLDENERSYFDVHLPRFAATLALVPNGNADMRLLELGAAFHHQSPALLRWKKYGEVRCADVWDGSPQDTRQVTSATGDETFSFVVDNFDVQDSRWPYDDGAFDFVLCCEMLEHLYSDPAHLLAELNRVLTIGGRLLLTTPNLASGHAVQETMVGGSPYAYGKFDVGGRATDRHNREYTYGEVERLAISTGFATEILRTREFYWPTKRETLRLLASRGLSIGRRGDCTFLLARKTGEVQDRYPEEFYVTTGLQSRRREQQSGGAAASAPPRCSIVLVHEILPHFDCSGADLRLYELLRELRAEGHRVALIARDNRDEEKYRPLIEALGVQVYAGDPERLRHVGSIDPPSWSLQEVLEREHFDIAILSHWFWSGISIPEHYLDEIRSVSPGTRVLVLSEDRHGERERRSAQLSGFLSDIERGNNFEQREKEIYERADLVLYVTETDHRRFAELVPGLPAEHLPTIAEAAGEGPGFDSRTGVLFLGNFENLANRDALEWLLTNVWPKVRKSAPDLQLYIAGHAAPQDLVSHQGVVCLGKVDDLAPLFGARRLFAAPIRYGTGIITKNMHAIAHGLPVVTTSVGAEGMALVNNEHALIANSPDDFAAAILRLYRDQDLWTRIAAQGRSFIRSQFSLENLRSQIRKIVRRSLTLRPRAAEPARRWSYRAVEDASPEVLTQHPPQYRPLLRTLAYWQLGRKSLDSGNPGEALEQFRHIFTFVRGRMPASVFHTALLNDMARAYRQLGNAEMARLCEKEKDHCIWSWPTKAPRPSPEKKKASGSVEISVVLPTYNRAEILRLCLAALAFQSLPANRWEAVIVDDGSTDATASLCRDILLPFSVRYSRQENGGTGSARRTGVAAAQGEFLLLCNDDTIASSNLLVEHLAYHRNHPRESYAVLGDFRYGEETATSALCLFVNLSVFFFPQRTLKPGQICDQAYFVTYNLSVRRRDVLNAGNFDPAFRVAEDTELGTRLVQSGTRVVYHPDAVSWHEHPNFTTNDLLRRATAYADADWLLFAKHPRLFVNGAGPFGTLSLADRQRIAAQVARDQAVVEQAVIALQALDRIDFRAFFRNPGSDSGAPNEVIAQLRTIVPLVYWHFLFQRFLEHWQPVDACTSSESSELPAPAANPV